LESAGNKPRRKVASAYDILGDHTASEDFTRAAMTNHLTLPRIMDSVSNGVIATDSAGRIRFLNEQAVKILGFDPKRVLGTYIPDILPMTGPLVIKCLETGEPQLGRHILGKKVSLVLNITPIRERGRLRGAVCSFERMREFERTAKKLESYRRLNEQLNAVISSSSDGIWVCDGSGTVITINRASEKLNGIKARKFIGKNVVTIVEQRLVDRSVTMEVLETKRQVSMMQHVRRTDKYLLVTGTPVFDERGNIALVVVNERDMTHLNAIREQLEQSRRVTEKYKEELAELSMLELREQEIIAESEAMQQVLRVALKLARMGVSNILLLGESGTGKGLLAKFIHRKSRRKAKPFIQINCAALPETLLEAELFGYEKGAFTGAREQGKVGLFELAKGGTLFLDEIGDLPFSVQAKLLKYLDDREILPLGGTKPRVVDCTIIAATNRDLEGLVNQGSFRRDLYYRLNSFTIRIPPLRERPEDSFELARYFVRRYNKKHRVQRRLSPQALIALQQYPFSGNVRELENVIRKAVVMSESDILDEHILATLSTGTQIPAATDGGPKGRLAEELVDRELELLKTAVAHCRSTREMARYLGVSQPTVVRKLRKHGIARRLIQK
jgi:PAS domain S-box-containing protein